MFFSSDSLRLLFFRCVLAAGVINVARNLDSFTGLQRTTALCDTSINLLLSVSSLKQPSYDRCYSHYQVSGRSRMRIVKKITFLAFQYHINLLCLFSPFLHVEEERHSLLTLNYLFYE